ncbi:ABC transporter permease [Sulfidibacter corallicola]|uniref:ABC transporter permease n=1 Tax=Sulfidibacter corallicola TaxID=2818388 RepID=A0A8A4U0T5_SULCO|nr:ABC transporter permease [Sulfidibacter corallicola]QTD52355.1 ABC transporter permease [Sulfidibacter corallicola]
MSKQSQWRLTFEVTRWEFMRFFKPREMMVSLGLTVGLLLGLNWMIRGAGSQGEPAQVKLINQSELMLVIPETSSLAVVDALPEEAESDLREAVAAKELDGLLIVRGVEDAELVVLREPHWRAELEKLLAIARLSVQLDRSGVSQEAFAEMMAPFPLTLSALRDDGGGFRERMILSFVCIGFMLMAIFVGNAYLFSAITGEKQLRVTEQLVAAISPRIWIDGKILGMAGLALVNVAIYAVSSFIAVLILQRLGVDVPLALEVVDVGLALKMVSLAVLGFLFWFTAFAAVAATINDPMNSARNAFMFVPMIPVAVGFLVFTNPEHWGFRLLGMFPLTSAGVMPARLVLAEVPAWEMAVALASLVVACWMMRQVAGKVFALGIFMQGKEPSWSEMIAAARRV